MNLKTISLFMILTFLLIILASCAEQAPPPPPKSEKKVTKRVGMVIGIKPEVIAEYKALHDDSNPGVRDLLTIANMENFSIFIHQFDDGNYYLFGYYECIA